MTFLQYVKSKTKVLIIFFAINAFALFVNVFEISGYYESKPAVGEGQYYSLLDTGGNSIFTAGMDKDTYSNFWPFVKYTYKQENGIRRDGRQNYISGFLGIFYRYDYSEFLAYGILIFIVLYFRWANKYEKK